MCNYLCICTVFLYSCACGGAWCCLHVWAAVDSAAVNTGLHGLVKLSFVWTYAQEWIPGLCGNSVFSLKSWTCVVLGPGPVLQAAFLPELGLEQQENLGLSAVKLQMEITRVPCSVKGKLPLYVPGLGQVEVLYKSCSCAPRGAQAAFFTGSALSCPAGRGVVPRGARYSLDLG